MLAANGHRRLLISVRLSAALIMTATVITACSSGTPAGTEPSAPSSRSSTVASSSRASSSAPAPAPTLGVTATASSIPESAAAGATVPPVPVCRTRRCRVDREVALGRGYVIRDWVVPSGPANPVLELLHAGRPIAWMVLPRGEAIGATLTCHANAAVPNCVVVSPIGLHSAIGEMVLVPGGRLIDTAAVAVGATPTLVAADLNRDGYLDVVTRDSDYRPNFAEGHLFDRTYRFDPAHRRFVPTGCSSLLADPVHTPPPSALLSGHCPAV